MGRFAVLSLCLFSWSCVVAPGLARGEEAAPAAEAPPEASVATSELPPPFEFSLEAELRYAAMASDAVASEAWVSRLVARWIVMPLLEVRLDWGVAHVAATRTTEHLGATQDEAVSGAVFANPSLSVGLILTDTTRPYAAHGITVEMLAGLSLPTSNGAPSDAMDGRCLGCNLATLSDGAQRPWTWLPMTLAGYLTMAVRTGRPDNWFFGTDGSVAGMLRSLGDEDADAAWSLDGGLEGGWVFGRWLALGVRLQGALLIEEYDAKGIGSVVPFVELDVLEHGFVRLDATLDLWSFANAPWAAGVRGGFAF